MSLAKALQQLTQVFLQTSCPLCQRAASSLPLCDSCYRQLLACQWSNSDQDFEIHTLSGSSHRPVFAWGKYQGVLKQALSSLKYGCQTDLGFWLGCQLGQYWQSSKLQTIYRQRPVVVPIPLHSQRLKQRGYNQAALIAKGFCRVTRQPFAEHGLRRIRATDAMYRLGLKERQNNLAGAFQLGKGLPSTSRPILLIDDIHTTGTTGNTAARPLIQAGYTVIGLATVAQAVLLSPRAESPRPFHRYQTPNSHPILWFVQTVQGLMMCRLPQDLSG